MRRNDDDEDDDEKENAAATEEGPRRRQPAAARPDVIDLGRNGLLLRLRRVGEEECIYYLPGVD